MTFFSHRPLTCLKRVKLSMSTAPQLLNSAQNDIKYFFMSPWGALRQIQPPPSKIGQNKISYVILGEGVTAPPGLLTTTMDIPPQHYYLKVKTLVNPIPDPLTLTLTVNTLIRC